MKRVAIGWGLAVVSLSLHCSSGESGRQRYGNIAVSGAGSGVSTDDGLPAWQLPDAELEGAAPVAPERSPLRIIDWDPLPSLLPRSSQELGAYFAPGAELVGVALDERDESAQPYLLEAHAGLYQLTASGSELVFDLRASRVSGGTGDGSPPVELTDVAFEPVRSSEQGAPVFVLTADNDGFALDLRYSDLASYFCYLPRSPEPLPTPGPSVSQQLRQQGVAVVERTEAVALNPITRQIVAQPRTLRLDNGAVAASELFVFDPAGGNPISTWQLEQGEFAAGGAAFLQGSYLMFGFGSDLYFAGDWGSDVVHQLHLEGVEKITGLAARANGDLLVLDGPNRRLLEVGLQQLAVALGN
jgi:hypothetical protein